MPAHGSNGAAAACSGTADPAQKALAVRERIRGNFDRAASSYARFEAEGLFFQRLLLALSRLGPSLRGKRVLDVGCGSGASLAGLLDAVGPAGQVVGLDLSLGMLQEAKRRLGAGSLLLQADGCRFGKCFRLAFDAVVYNAVLFMLPDARASLAAAAEVLRPGGAVLISSLEEVCAVPERRMLADVLQEKGFKPGRHALSPWRVVEEALLENFEAPVVAEQTVPLDPPSFLSFYGLEPMSAGLLPSDPYPVRKTILSDLAREWESKGTGAEQVWKLASAQRRN